MLRARFVAAVGDKPHPSDGVLSVVETGVDMCRTLGTWCGRAARCTGALFVFACLCAVVRCLAFVGRTVDTSAR